MRLHIDFLSYQLFYIALLIFYLFYKLYTLHSYNNSQSIGRQINGVCILYGTRLVPTPGFQPSVWTGVFRRSAPLPRPGEHCVCLGVSRADARIPRVSVGPQRRLPDVSNTGRQPGRAYPVRYTQNRKWDQRFAVYFVASHLVNIAPISLIHFTELVGISGLFFSYYSNTFQL